MSVVGLEDACVICGGATTTTIEPARRTVARGADPDDLAYSIIAVLPDIALCAEHAAAVLSGVLPLSWCDTGDCRRFGERGEESPCGQPYSELRR